MNKPSDYDSVNISSVQLPPGGYVCRIMSVEETSSKASGREMLKVSLDIAEGVYANHFAKLYRANPEKEKNWGCIMYILIKDNEGRTNRDFKRFVTAAEESNLGFNAAWGSGFEKCFKDKLIGALFGREQFKSHSGELRWSCKPKNWGLRKASDIREGKFQVPEDKPYIEKEPTGSVFIPDDTEYDDLPF